MTLKICIINFALYCNKQVKQVNEIIAYLFARYRRG